MMEELKTFSEWIPRLKVKTERRYLRDGNSLFVEMGTGDNRLLRKIPEGQILTVYITEDSYRDPPIHVSASVRTQGDKGENVYFHIDDEKEIDWLASVAKFTVQKPAPEEIEICKKDMQIRFLEIQELEALFEKMGYEVNHNKPAQWMAPVFSGGNRFLEIAKEFILRIFVFVDNGVVEYQVSQNILSFMRKCKKRTTLIRQVNDLERGFNEWKRQNQPKEPPEIRETVERINRVSKDPKFLEFFKDLQLEGINVPILMAAACYQTDGENCRDQLRIISEIYAKWQQRTSEYSVFPQDMKEVIVSFREEFKEDVKTIFMLHGEYDERMNLDLFVRSICFGFSGDIKKSLYGF